MAVASDERFRETKTRWIFWAVSDDIAPNIRVRARQPNRPEGLVLDVPELRLSVWVKSWDRFWRVVAVGLEFFRRNLQYEADDESAIALLKKLHAKYLRQSSQEKIQSLEIHE